MDGPSFVKLVERELSSRGISKQEFYDATGISSATFSQWRKGKYVPSSTAISKVEEFLSIRLEITKKDSPAPDEGEAAQLRRDIHTKIDALSDDEFEALKPALAKLLGKE